MSLCPSCTIFFLGQKHSLHRGAPSLFRNLLPVNSPPPLPLHSKESSFFGLKPVPLFISLLLFVSSVFLTHPIFTAFKKGLILSFPDCPRRVVLPSQAILSKLAAQLSTFLKCQQHLCLFCSISQTKGVRRQCPHHIYFVCEKCEKEWRKSEDSLHTQLL